MNDCAGRETFRLKFNELREYRLCESNNTVEDFEFGPSEGD